MNESSHDQSRNGLLLVDKPGGMTSHDVVARVRRLLDQKSVGHLGTLDPMATGLLPLLVGKWTRLAQFFGSLPKAYTGTMCFGFGTDTFDAEGARVGPVTAPRLTLEQLQGWAAEMLGDSEQVPPAYSAKKIGGKPAYALARAGMAPELRSSAIHIDHFEVTSLSCEHDGTAKASFCLRISAGGYVRSVAHQLGVRAGCGAHLTTLRRVAAGPLQIADALTLGELEQHLVDGTLSSIFPHPRTVLPELPAVGAGGATLVRLRNGMQVALPEFSSAPLVRVFASQQRLVAIARRVAGVLFQPAVVLD